MRKAEPARIAERNSPFILICFVLFFVFFSLGKISESSYYSSRTVGVDYLAGDLKPTSVADLMETYDYEQSNNNPSTSQPHATASSAEVVDETFVIRQHQVGQQQHHHQQTDIPLQLSDILPADRRSYDKMEPPKREGDLTSPLATRFLLCLYTGGDCRERINS